MGDGQFDCQGINASGIAFRITDSEDPEQTAH